VAGESRELNKLKFLVLDVLSEFVLQASVGLQVRILCIYLSVFSYDIIFAPVCFCLSVVAELNSMKLLVQRVIATLSQTVTDTQSSSLLDLKSLAALGKQMPATSFVLQCSL